MIGVFSVIALGFFLGMRHATDPDHVIAVTTIVSRERSIGPAAWIGALWGLGHTITIFAVGAGIILVGWVIPARLGLSMEFSVGLMLILLGILNLTGMLQWVNDQFLPGPAGSSLVHSHAHSHGGHVHTHPHVHDPESHSHAAENTSLGFLDRAFGKLGMYQTLRPLVVGLVHGLAGSAAVALLVLATIRQPRWAVAYLLVFGIGTIAGMMLITAAIAIPFTYASNRFTNLNRTLRIATGLLSLAFGLFLTYQIGIVHGLFTSHPQWTPR
jgi:high-affinity nickel-transport protein